MICTRMTRSGVGSGIILPSLSLYPKPSFEMLVNFLSFEMLMRLIRKSMSMSQTFAIAL